MKLATLLIVVLSNQGYWFGGQAGTITLHPAVRAGLPGAALLWELRFAGVRLGSGALAVGADDTPTILHLTPPAVRTRITLHWVYRIVRKSDGKELDAGDVPIEVFPDNLLAGLAGRVGKHRIVIFDSAHAADGLAKTLAAAKVPIALATDAGQLQVMSADVVLVGADMLDGSPMDQGPLAALAESGTSVMAFHQRPADRLFSYAVTLRKAPASGALQWRTEHPLLSGFSVTDLRSWLSGQPTLDALELSADSPVLDIVSYPRETPGRMPVGIDAVALTKSVGRGGKGRVVLWQLPLGNFSDDPRSQMLLGNAIDYLLTRPQPTPPPSQRPTTQGSPRKSAMAVESLIVGGPSPSSRLGSGLSIDPAATGASAAGYERDSSGPMDLVRPTSRP